MGTTIGKDSADDDAVVGDTQELDPNLLEVRSSPESAPLYVNAVALAGV